MLSQPLHSGESVLLASHAVSHVAVMLREWRPSVFLSRGLWSDIAAKSGNRHMTGHLQAEADPDRSMLWSRSLLRRPVGSVENVEFCTSTACVRRLAESPKHLFDKLSSIISTIHAIFYTLFYTHSYHQGATVNTRSGKERMTSNFLNVLLNLKI